MVDYLSKYARIPPALLWGWMAYPLPWGERVRVRGR